MTIQQAEVAAGVHLIRPTDPHANDTNIRAVFFERIPGDSAEVATWARQDLVHVAIDYQSGILVTIELVNPGSPFDVDPMGQYRAMAADGPSGSVATTLNSAPALAIPSDASGPAVVDETMRGERVTVASVYSSYDLATVETIAGTLA